MNLPLILKLSNGDYVNLSLVAWAANGICQTRINPDDPKTTPAPCLRLWGPRGDDGDPFATIVGDDIGRVRLALDKLASVAETHLPAA